MFVIFFFSFNFVYFLVEWGLFVVGGWVFYFGIKVKKMCIGILEQCKELVLKKFVQCYYFWGSILLVVMIFGILGGMVVIYLNNGKLFVGLYLLVGLVMIGMIVVVVLFLFLMQWGNVIVCKVYVGLNMGMFMLFFWQVVSGMEIVNKIWINC